MRWISRPTDDGNKTADTRTHETARLQLGRTLAGRQRLEFYVAAGVWTAHAQQPQTQRHAAGYAPSFDNAACSVRCFANHIGAGQPSSGHTAATDRTTFSGAAGPGSRWSRHGGHARSGDSGKNVHAGAREQLRAALNARGIRSMLTRTSDVTLDNDARATTANHSHAAACISLHATSTGNGVHLFTSSLPAVTEADPRRVFLPWQTAQAAYETSSLRLESDVDAALTQQHIPVLIAELRSCRWTAWRARRWTLRSLRWTQTRR